MNRVSSFLKTKSVLPVITFLFSIFGFAEIASAGWVYHTWVFKDSATQQSYILDRTDSEYTTYIASVDAQCRLVNSNNYAWKPNAGNDSDWQSFGIPDCSGSSYNSYSTYSGSNSSGSGGSGGSYYYSSTTSSSSSSSSSNYGSGSGSSGSSYGSGSSSTGSSSGSSSGSTITIADTIPPLAVQFGSFTESDGRIHAGLSFSEQIDGSSVSTSNVYIILVSSGERVEGTPGRYFSGVDYVTSRPATTGVDYQLIVKDIKDVAGNKMATEYRSALFRSSIVAAHSMATTTPSGTTTATTTPNNTESPPTYYQQNTATTTTATTTPTISTTATSTENMTSGSAIKNATKTVSGFVLFSNNKPVTDAFAGAYNSSTGAWVRVSVDSGGSYVFKVNGGKWKVGTHPKTETANWGMMPYPQEVYFSEDLSEENKIINFTVPLSDSTVIVKAVDEKGTPLAGVGIIVDVSRASSQVTTGDRFMDSRSTDSGGLATFSLPSNVYYVRGYFSSEDFVNPEEQRVTVAPGAAANVTIVFKRKSAAQATGVTLSGVAKYEDGSLADGAYVGAWSEEGEFRNTRADSSGNFSLLISKNNRWHISAGKEVGHVPYKSSEIVIVTTNNAETVEMVLTRYKDNRVLPASVEVASKAVEDLTAKVSDGAKVTIPANSAQGAVGTTVNVEVTPTIEAPSQAAAQVVGTAYDISVKDNYGIEVTNFSKKIEVTLPYREEDLKAEGVTEDTIRPSYFDEKAGVWVVIDDFIIDKVNNLIIARVDHLTRFAIVSPADITPPTPPSQLAASLAGGAIKLAWLNPKSDFAHSKVYRSTEENKLGSVLVAEVESEVYVDEMTERGVDYFYTVRAIDPAGNESTNTNQVKITGVGATSQKVKAAKQLPTPVAGRFARMLKYGTRGNDVTLLQEFLAKEGVYPEALITGYFGKLTQKAVVLFQEKYAKEVLAPAKLSKGTGFVGVLTRKKLNALAEE